VTTQAELVAMRRAIELSAEGLGTTSPNPVVGAVILDRDGEVVGEGFHERAGGPHAEVVALGRAGARARGGTAVVTLEPCRTTGRTPPCVDALCKAGVSRVRYAVADPTSAGGGAQELAESGLDVVGGVLTEAAARVNEAWLHAVRRGRPFVVWKSATTLDGRVAAADGSSRWITGPEARADVHRLRARLDAVLVGSGTALIDDPQLTVRDDEGRIAGRQPLRVVLDRRGRVPVTARVRDAAAPSLVVHEPEPAAALAVLFDRGVRSVLLEGGPQLTAAFLAAGLVDKAVCYIAPALLGEGPGAVAPFGVGSIEAAVRLRIDEVELVGGDLKLTAYPVEEG
jgi:diaminohydroxyphosphoribosylaminopyrimidine deaminase/5-amino-6-(5-phosphoribosylamino)uracil reductase